jgi:hypothetical protein
MECNLPQAGQRLPLPRRGTARPQFPTFVSCVRLVRYCALFQSFSFSADRRGRSPQVPPIGSVSFMALAGRGGLS